MSQSRLPRFLACLALIPPLVAIVPAATADGPALQQDGHSVTLTNGAYSIVIGKAPFSITTKRAGRTVLATASGGALDFTGPVPDLVLDT